jgi:hypothetical protein
LKHISGLEASRELTFFWVCGLLKRDMRLSLTWVLILLLLTGRVLAQPTIVPDAAVMKLDELGLYSAGYAYRGQPERRFPIGWTGFFEEKTGVACEPYGVQNGKQVFLLHCPWRNGTGITFQEFSFQTPAVSRIRLRGATAMKSDMITKSDGVTFRIYTNGIKGLEYHQTNDVWQPFEFQFAPLTGSNLVVRFEVDPGPRNNASCDYAFWGDRELVFEGYHPVPRTNPPPPALALSKVWSARTGDVVPRGGFGGSTRFQVSNQLARFHYAAADGTLDYAWRAPQSTNDPLFGALTLTAQMAGDAPVTVPLAKAATIAWTAAATLQTSFFQATNRGVALYETFLVGGSKVQVCAVGRLIGKSLVLSVTCDQPVVKVMDAGKWGPTLRCRQMVVPYLDGAVSYLPRENLFVNAFLDWTASAASSHNSTRADYNALTDGTRNRLRERVIFSAAWHQAEVFPNLPGPPSPHLGFLADKVVLDIWGGSFASIAGHLAGLADYGMRNCIALVHVWQRSGYDNALPAHVPAKAGQGGDSGMSNLVAAVARSGMRAALHENYVDYYPNYDFYDPNDIALDSQASLVKAWYNSGTQIQSFAVKPNAILRLAATQSPEIHRRYHTAADYLDVHSAVPPWFHVDFRAGEPGAGTFARVWDIHRQLWAYERATHRGPVFGEGNRHFYWSGWLDGVEAQFGTGWPENQGLTAPLHVDFDLLKIHPLQFNHGMGYYERWWPAGYHTHWRGSPPLAVLDQYRAQEVAYGHAGFLAGPTCSSIPYAWLEYHLLSPVTARYGNAKPVQISYWQNGVWLDPTAAAKSETQRDCVRIAYDSGLTVTVNASTNNLAVHGTVLPQFGWLAEGNGVIAGTTLRGGVITDFADTGDSLFANARSAADWDLSGCRRVHPAVAQFQQTAARVFRVTYRWDVSEVVPRDYRCFVHLCQTNSIKIQQDHILPTSQWQAGRTVNDGPYTITVGAAIADGDYDWLIGLYEQGGGGRLNLLGADAGQSRIRLGTLRLANSGATLTFIPEANTNYTDPSCLHHAHLNSAGIPIDFGDLRTDGSVWLRREGAQWVLKTWPRDRSFTLELSAARFGAPARVRCIGGPANTLSPVPLGRRWYLPLNGAREYRWAANDLKPPNAARSGDRKMLKRLDPGS